MSVLDGIKNFGESLSETAGSVKNVTGDARKEGKNWLEAIKESLGFKVGLRNEDIIKVALVGLLLIFVFKKM